MALDFCNYNPTLVVQNTPKYNLDCERIFECGLSLENLNLHTILAPLEIIHGRYQNNQSLVECDVWHLLNWFLTNPVVLR